MFALIAAAALLAPDIPPAGPDDTQAAYQVAKSTAGRSPAEQIRLAYWCEAHGLTAERARHLALAVLADPTNAAARGLLGLVARQDKWMRPDAVADQVKADAPLAATLAEYDQKRAATAYTAEGQWNLAQWAEAHGLPAQARAHYTAVVRLDSTRELAWKKLGYKRQNGRWTTDAELATHKADADAQRVADAKWRPLLEKWKAMLGKAATRAEGEAGLLTVTDPRAVRHVAALFLSGSTADPATALRILSQIDSAASSRLITMIAVLADDPNTRRTAVETLRQRDPRDYADLLIRSLRERVEYEIQRVNGPGSVGRLLIKNSKRKVQRLYSTPAVPNYLAWLTELADGSPTLTYHWQNQVVSPEVMLSHQWMNTASLMKYHSADATLNAAVANTQQHAGAEIQEYLKHHYKVERFREVRPETFKQRMGFEVELSKNTTTPVTTDQTINVAAMVAEYQKAAYYAEAQLTQDAASLDQYNNQVNESNDRLTMVLRTVSGEDHGTNIADWSGWMLNLSGYTATGQSTSEIPTETVNVPLAYQPQMVPMTAQTYATGVTSTHFQASVVPMARLGGTSDCFGAGTLVRTMTGPQAIETLQAGDLVLTQSTDTGALHYQPILMVHHNPPSPTFHLKLDSDTIRSSPFHRFWKVGVGWVMARDIQAGDRLRLLNGTALVESSITGPVERVYNLDIADDADFFAGQAAVLVHDNTLLNPRLIPFDLPPSAETRAITAR